MTHVSKWTNPVEISSALETTEVIDRQKEKEYAALEFSSDGKDQRQYVKCQKCGENKRIVGKLHTPKTTNDRMSVLQKRIKWYEDILSHNDYDSNAKHSSAAVATKELKGAKDELALLEAEDQKWERFRRLPLYSTKCTGYLIGFFEGMRKAPVKE